MFSFIQEINARLTQQRTQKNQELSRKTKIIAISFGFGRQAKSQQRGRNLTEEGAQQR
jgi:hypothetical protein